MRDTDLDRTLRDRFHEIVTEPAGETGETETALVDVHRRVRRRRRRRTSSRIAAVAVVAAAGVGVLAAQGDPGDDVATGPPPPQSSDGAVNLVMVGWREGPQLADPQTQNAAPLGPTMGGNWRWCNTCPLVRVADRAYTAQNGRLFSYTPGDTALRDMGTADAVFATADGQGLLVLDDRTLEERSLDGDAVAGPWALPDGYELTSPPRAASGGVLVTDRTGFIGELAWWEPTRGDLRPIGEFQQVIDVHADPGTGSDVLAWTDCPTGSFPCSLVLAAGGVERRTIDPPVDGNGFYAGGAFSPDGTTLAVTLSTSPGTVDPTAALALVDVQSGRVEVVDGSQFGVGEPYGYAAWSPDGTTVFFTGDAGVRSYRPADRQLTDLPLPGTYYSVAALPGLDRRSQCPGSEHPWQLGPATDQESGDGLPASGTTTDDAARAALADALGDHDGADDAFVWAEPGRAWSRRPDGTVDVVPEVIRTVVVRLDSPNLCPDAPGSSPVPLTFLVADDQ